jgi:regulator of protease activity HflC (stomatin/prohibitin superfamily)
VAGRRPNEAALATLFGHYAGTDRAEGLRWANPFYVKRRISLRARNLNSPALKVNDKRGNPIDIGAVIVWRVEDTAKARFEADSADPCEITLRGGLDDVAQALKTALMRASAAPASRWPTPA